MQTEMPAVIASRYRVLRELGRGGMGVVYLVEHVHTGEQLALKVLLAQAGADAGTVERFKREARAPARIKSDYVVRVTDADVAPELGGAPFLVMEALDGTDLERMLEHRGALPPAEVVWLLRQAAIALDKAHAIGIVHRDLKPENLFLHRREDGPPILKILDFGISKMTGSNDIQNAGLTKTGAMMGTPLYMAPEQARSQAGGIGPATDVWAIGLIALNLLTGTVYWTAETVTELLLKIVVEPMPPPSVRFPGFGAHLDAWFARSCDRNPAQRFRSVGEQIAALAQALRIEYAHPAASLEWPTGAYASHGSIPDAEPPRVPDGAANSATRYAVSAATNPQVGSATVNAMARSTNDLATTAKPRSAPFVALGVTFALGACAIAAALVWKSHAGAAPVTAASVKEAPPITAATTVPAPERPLTAASGSPDLTIAPNPAPAAEPPAAPSASSPKATAEPPRTTRKPAATKARKPTSTSSEKPKTEAPKVFSPMAP